MKPCLLCADHAVCYRRALLLYVCVRVCVRERESVCVYVCASLQRQLYYGVPLKDCTETAVSLLTETDATNSLARPEGSERERERE